MHRRPGRSRPRVAHEGQRQRRADATGDVVLQVEEIAERGLHRVRRQQRAIRRPHQLRRRADLVSRPQQRAHHHPIDVRLGGQGLQVGRRRGEAGRGGARPDDQRAQPRQRGRDRVGQAEGEEVGLRIRAEDVEGQHDQARQRVRQRGRPACLHAGDGAQLDGHRLGRFGPVGRALRQRLPNDPIDGRGGRRSHERRGVLVQRRVQDVHHRAADEGGPPGEHLEEDGPRGKEVRARVHHAAGHLLGRHVARRAHHEARAGEPAGRIQRGLRLGPRQAEVEQLDAVRRQEHVRRLQVAMDDAAAVEGGQGRQDPEGHRHRVGDAHRTAVQPIGERLALEQLHRDEEAGRVLADFVDLADVGMVDARRGARLAPEAPARRLVGRQRRHHLDGDRAPEALVAGLVHHAHAALAQAAAHRVVPDAGGQGLRRRINPDRGGRIPAGGHRRGRRSGQPLEERAKWSAAGARGLVRHRLSIIRRAAPRSTCACRDVCPRAHWQA